MDVATTGSLESFIYPWSLPGTWLCSADARGKCVTFTLKLLAVCAAKQIPGQPSLVQFSVKVTL